MVHAHLITFVCLACLLIGGCDDGSTTPAVVPEAEEPTKGETAMAPGIRIKVLADGSLLADDQPVTITHLDQRFADLARGGGVVWYYREAGESDPPPVAMEVMELVVKHQLPITMSSRPDFSDAIDDQGRSRPR